MRSKSGLNLARYPSTASTARAVIPASVWFGSIRSRSSSGLIPNASRTWSSISRCWAVTQTSQEKRGSFLSARMTGASLMASGRVPKMMEILLMGLEGSCLQRQMRKGRGQAPPLPSLPSFAGGEGQVALHHHLDEAVEADAWLPAEFG